MEVAVLKADRAGRIATRTDSVSQVSEDATFVTAGEDELFCVLYRPASTPRGRVVICSSILAEHLTLYRPEVLAARAFAANGFAVIRFHYRGTGHSGGVPEAMTLDSMIDDTLVAADVLVDATGARPMVFCGARWGAMVAGLAARRRPHISVAMWEPAIDSDRFLGEAIRAQQMVALTSGESNMITREQALQEMRSAGYADLLGHPIYLRLYESTAGRSLAEVADGPPRQIMLIQVSNRPQLKPDFARLIESWRRNGSVVESALIKREETWSLNSPRHSAGALIQNTLGWLGRLGVAS